MAEEDGREIVPESSIVHGEPCGRSHTDAENPAAGVNGTCTIGDHVHDLLEACVVERRNGSIVMTGPGRERARHMIRRHRLAEMLLTQILDLEPGSEQAEVCAMEHAISPRIADRMCAFLGHPPQCPHGRPIPPGACCQRQDKDIKPLVGPLTEGRIGEKYRIAFIAARHHARLDRLGVLGITAGSEVVLHQKKPSFVVRVGETDVAIDGDIARDICVRPA